MMVYRHGPGVPRERAHPDGHLRTILTHDFRCLDVQAGLSVLIPNVSMTVGKGVGDSEREEALMGLQGHVDEDVWARLGAIAEEARPPRRAITTPRRSNRARVVKEKQPRGPSRADFVRQLTHLTQVARS